ncbi:hypothetical protein TWF481_009380 [Arthrobotrys musiformis]|uniref:RRM domain-containing protein n=1 Tax=Arthrobotrys musiformis TaxID=47236 RepID=A0AAV9W3I3_9PEZI
MSDRPAAEAAAQAGQYGNDMSAQARRRMQVPSIITGVNGMGDNGVVSPGGVEMQFTPLLPSQLLLGSPFQTGTPQTGFGQFPAAFNQQNPAAALSPTAYNSAGGIVSPTAFTPQYATFFPQQSPTVGSPLPAGMVSGTSRTVYLGNIPDETSAEEILGHVRSGPIESVRLLPDKNCAFISFLDGSSATHFHSDAILKKLSIKGQDIKIGWGKPSQVPTSVALAVQQSGASRNVYLGNLPEDITEEELRTELGKFGAIDTVKLVREKNIGFVHFLSIGNAIKAVTQLPQETKWQAPRRVYYGKDRCAYVSKTQQQNAAQYLGINPSMAHALSGQDREVISNAIAQQSVAAAAVATSAGGYNNLGNRTVYLGNIHPETTIEEICNVVRGGLLHHIRYIADKHICFVTFIDPTAAASFYALSNLQGLMIHNRRLKIGWGKHSGALPPAIALAVSGGASRNVYIGNLDETWTEERLRQDFSEYGEIELVNTLREKSCAFVNFTNIANAIKAIEAIRGKEDYRKFKINFGKDRCGNAPRQNAPGVQVNGAEQSPNGLNNGSGSHHSGSPTSQPALSPSPNSMQQQAQSSYITTNPLHAYLAQQQQQQEAAAYNAAIQQLSAYQPENGAANGAANGNGQIPANGNNNLGLPRSSSHNRAVSLPVLSLMGGNANGNQNGHSFGMSMGGSNAWPENE